MYFLSFEDFSFWQAVLARQIQVYVFVAWCVEKSALDVKLIHGETFLSCQRAYRAYAAELACWRKCVTAFVLVLLSAICIDATAWLN